MIAANTRKTLGQFLLDKGIVQQEQLDRALEVQKQGGHQKLLGEVLVESRTCTEDQIVEALAQAYAVPYARVSPKVADPKVIQVLPKEFLEKHQTLPLYLVEGVLTVAVSEPANVFLLEEIERLSGYQVQVVAATARDIKSTLQAYLPNDKVFVIDELIEESEPVDFALEPQPVSPPHGAASANGAKDLAASALAAGDSPVIKLVNFIIFSAIRESATDIHIEPGEDVLRVRYRLDGRLIEKMRPPHQMHSAVITRIKSLAAMNVVERHLPQQGAMRVTMDKRPIDLRVSTMPGRFGEKAVIRVVDYERAPSSLEKLGFNYDTLKAWRKLIHSPQGIVIVTGPAGSGKTTTLYASMHELNNEGVNICTVEDPIGSPIAGVNQFQVNPAAGLTFTGALGAVLRQDPDIVMVGEIRDAETARLAAQAALTGHLVLSALHTGDAAGAIARLCHLGIEPYMVGASVAGVMAQRLVRKLCQHCKEPYTPTMNERRQIDRPARIDTLFKPRGCERCRNLGFSGRIGIYELLIPNDELTDCISRGAALTELRELCRKTGMTTLRADAMEKVKAGITTLDEIFRSTA